MKPAQKLWMRPLMLIFLALSLSFCIVYSQQTPSKPEPNKDQPDPFPQDPAKQQEWLLRQASCQKKPCIDTTNKEQREAVKAAYKNSEQNKGGFDIKNRDHQDLLARILSFELLPADAAMANALVLARWGSSDVSATKIMLEQGIQARKISFKVKEDGSIVIIDGEKREHSFESLSRAGIVGIRSDQNGILTYLHPNGELIARFEIAKIEPDGRIIPKGDRPVRLTDKVPAQILEIVQTENGIRYECKSASCSFEWAAHQVPLSKGQYLERNKDIYSLFGVLKGELVFARLDSDSGIIYYSKQPYILSGSIEFAMKDDMPDFSNILLKQEGGYGSYASTYHSKYGLVHAATGKEGSTWACLSGECQIPRNDVQGFVKVDETSIQVSGLAYARVHGRTMEGFHENMVFSYRSIPELLGNKDVVELTSCKGCPPNAAGGVVTANGQYLMVRTEAVGRDIRMHLERVSVPLAATEAYKYAKANEDGILYSNANLYASNAGSGVTPNLMMVNQPDRMMITHRLHHILEITGLGAPLDPLDGGMIILDRNVPYLLAQSGDAYKGQRVYRITYDGQVLADPLENARSQLHSLASMIDAPEKIKAELDGRGLIGVERQKKGEELYQILWAKAEEERKLSLAAELINTEEKKLPRLGKYDLDEAYRVLFNRWGYPQGYEDLFKAVSKAGSIQELAHEEGTRRLLVGDLGHWYNMRELSAAKKEDVSAVSLFNLRTMDFETHALGGSREEVLSIISSLERNAVLQTITMYREQGGTDFYDPGKAAITLSQYLKYSLPLSDQTFIDRLMVAVQSARILDSSTAGRLLSGSLDLNGPYLGRGAYTLPTTMVSNSDFWQNENVPLISGNGRVVVTDPGILSLIRSGALAKEDVALLAEVVNDVASANTATAIRDVLEHVIGSENRAQLALLAFGVGAKPIISAGTASLSLWFRLENAMDRFAHAGSAAETTSLAMQRFEAGLAGVKNFDELQKVFDSAPPLISVPTYHIRWSHDYFTLQTLENLIALSKQNPNFLGLLPAESGLRGAVANLVLKLPSSFTEVRTIDELVYFIERDVRTSQNSWFFKGDPREVSGLQYYLRYGGELSTYSQEFPMTASKLSQIETPSFESIKSINELQLFLARSQELDGVALTWFDRSKINALIGVYRDGSLVVPRYDEVAKQFPTLHQKIQDIFAVPETHVFESRLVSGTPLTVGPDNPMNFGPLPRVLADSHIEHRLLFDAQADPIFKSFLDKGEAILSQISDPKLQTLEALKISRQAFPTQTLLGHPSFEFADRAMPIGIYIEHGCGVCAHRAPLMKALLDRATPSVESRLVNDQRHVWLEVGFKNGDLYLADPTTNKFVPIIDPLTQLKLGSTKPINYDPAILR